MRIAATILILTAAAALASPWQMVIARKKANAGGSADYLTDLAHRWTFDSDLTDSVGSADGTAIGDAAVSGGALSLDGTNDGMYVARSALAGKTNVTVMMWIRPDSVASDFDLFVMHQHAGGHTLFWIDEAATDTLAYLLADANFSGTTQPGSSAFVRDGATWTHVAIAIGDNTADTYINGVADQNDTSTGIDTGPKDWGTEFLYFGIDSASAKDFYGLMDDIRIYDATLTSNQVQQVYDATAGGY